MKTLNYLFLAFIFISNHLSACRSLYYGEMWISLKSKQAEYALMTEDVIMKLKSTPFPEEQLIDLQREVVFNKVK
jgi:hypothetical protein